MSTTRLASPACPCCGRSFPKPKAVAAVIDPSQLSDREMFAYYKATAPVEDVRFQLRLSSLTPDVRAGYVALLDTLTDNAGKVTPNTKREYLRLQELWRVSRDGNGGALALAA